jgi:hypothetical protein
VISKGVGFLALLMLLPYAWMRWRKWDGIADVGAHNGWRWSAGALAFLAAIAVWFAPMVITAMTSGDAEHRAYLHELLFKQTATRYASAWHHTQPFGISCRSSRGSGCRSRSRCRGSRRAGAMRGAHAMHACGCRWRGRCSCWCSSVPAPASATCTSCRCSRWWRWRRGLFAGHRRQARVPCLPGGLVVVMGVVFLGAGAFAIARDPAFEVRIESERGLDAARDALWWMLALCGAAMLAAMAWWRRDALRGAAVALSLLVIVLSAAPRCCWMRRTPPAR